MTAAPPQISVIMATWGRGRHIVPSIRSVLGQTFRDFELIVVGDATTDETETVVAGVADQRVRWINLASRCGSQSAPNNAGIAAARGGIVAYLGHDDIWEPDHLAEIVGKFDGEADFVISGLITHRPNGLPGSVVYGLFTKDSAKHRFFFPPSSLAHRKDVTDRIGPWRMPMEVRAPVDEDLLLRAAAADLRFVSTGKITVHKFTAAERYLSYVQQRSDEQVAMLADIEASGHAQRVAAIVEQSRRLGKVMVEWPRLYDHHAPGAIARATATKRGLLRPALQTLGSGAVIRHRREPCALDWRARPILGIRLHGLNPRPRFLLPYSGQAAEMTFRLLHPDRSALGTLRLTCNDRPVTAQPERLRRSLWGWSARYWLRVELQAELPSVLEFDLAPAQVAKLALGPLRLGLGLGPIRLRPVT
jgi:hypothetical protein